MFLHEHTFSALLVIYLGVTLLGHIVMSGGLQGFSVFTSIQIKIGIEFVLNPVLYYQVQKIKSLLPRCGNCPEFDTHDT